MNKIIKNSGKILISGLLIFSLVGCGKVPVLKNGEEAVVTSDAKNISVTEFYEKIKEKYGVNVLVDMIDEMILSDKYKETTKEEKEYIKEKVKEVEDSAKQYNTTFEYLIAYYYGLESKTEFEKFVSLSYRRNEAVKELVKKGLTDKEIQKYYDENILYFDYLKLWIEKVKSNIELCNIIRKKIFIVRLECYHLIQEKETIINDNQLIGNITNFVEKCKREINDVKESAKNVLSIQIGKKKMRLRTKKQHNNMINQNTKSSVSPKVVTNQMSYVPIRPILLNTVENHFLDVKDILEEINSSEQDNPNQINTKEYINSNQPIPLTPLQGSIKVEVPLSTINSLGDNVFQPHKSIKELAQDLTYSELEDESTPVFIEKNQKKFNKDKRDFYSSVEKKINQLDNEFIDLQKSVFSILDR